MNLWSVCGNRVANWNVQVKSCFVSWKIIRRYGTSPRHVCHVSTPSLFKCLCRLPDCRPFVEGGLEVDVLWLRKNPVFSPAAGRLNLICRLWPFFDSIVLTVCSNTWLLISYFRSGTDRSTAEVQLSHKAIENVFIDTDSVSNVETVWHWHHTSTLEMLMIFNC